MKCPLCGKEFRYFCHLIKHLRCRHLGEFVEYERHGWCPICRTYVDNFADHLSYMVKVGDLEHAILYIARFRGGRYRRLAAKIVRDGSPTTSSITITKPYRGRGWRTEIVRIALSERSGSK